MERRSRAVWSGIGAFAVLGVFLAGVPACLVRLVGNPLPERLPAWSSVVATVESGALPPGVLVRVVAVVVWIWWSQVALSFVAEVTAAARGRTARPLPLRAFGMQPVVTRLVAILGAAAGTLGLLAQPVLGATPSFAGIAVPTITHGSVPGEMPPGEMPPGAGAGSFPLPPSLQDPLTAPAAPILAPPGGSAMSAVTPRPASAAGSTAPVLAPPEVRAAEPVSPALQAPSTSAREAPGPGVPAERAPRSAEPAAEIRASDWVVVKPGDSLSLLAETHLGDALRWEDIYELNSGPLPGGGTLRDPNLIHPGWRLRLPPIDPPGATDTTGCVPDPARPPANPPSPGPG